MKDVALFFAIIGFTFIAGLFAWDAIFSKPEVRWFRLMEMIFCIALGVVIIFFVVLMVGSK